ncbi:MAG: hypothetical protein NW218_18355 [Saprospiraceae bacterium]|nr:hypothetical protein [Saprospiraceae bacterium]
MQTQLIRSEVGSLVLPLMPQTFRHISPRTFVHCLHALFVNTKVLIDNVVSLHLHIAEHDEPHDDTPILLSQFQLELRSQGVALQRQIAFLSGTPLQPQEWIFYADIWRISDLSNTPLSLAQLRDATDLLAGLYERLLPTAASLSDQATSFYLLAEHLVALNEYCLALEHAHCASYRQFSFQQLNFLDA